MFSEYASRFLQQSNARLSFAEEQRPQSRNPLDRRRYQQRPGMGNPYQHPSTSQSRFPFASRLSRQDPAQAPLFYSVTDDFQEDDDEQGEHDREVADAWALQRSRQHFGPSNLTESSEMEDNAIERLEGQDHDREESTRRGRAPAPRVPAPRDHSVPESDVSMPSSKGKGRLEDVDLASTIHEEPPESLAGTSLMGDPDEPPVPFQEFRTQPKDPRRSSFMPIEADGEAIAAVPVPPSPDRESVPPTVILPAQEPPKHDAFWANIFQISLFAMFAAFVLIWFHTSTPTSKKPLGDTIYSALRASTNMLLWDTMLAVMVAMIWLALLRNYVRTLVFAILIAVPVVLFAFSLYPLIASFKGGWQGNSYQDRAMRWFAFIPAIVGAVWTFQVIRSRHSLARAISILEFSTKILAASPYLVALGFATLAFVVCWTWAWMLMFERIFLSGHFSATGAKRFLVDANSWWLGAFFILQYLWTLGVIAGVQRTTTAATVSQWYFHRLAVPQPGSQQVVRASFSHATGALFGTTCLSTFLSLLVRLPLIILPGRVSGLVNVCAYWLMPTSLATLTNPLTLTYAAIHSQPLGISARGLGQLNFVSRTNPSNTFGPRNFSPQAGSALIPYRLAKLLLQATRFMMSFALGFGGWVRTARNLDLDGSAGIRGSLYAYIVGLVAGTIGFAVLGAIENVVGAVLDAAVICWASETGGRTEARFCREAGELFGEDEPTVGRFSQV
ncbi:hypothetical protein LTR36_000275 [Oleoguttula mirabilis]|uniref:Protein PNS1 n=1 Tax=Oleoguttula mirabilis TaxID=1507867 RepID=A0AAV9JY29_9PEZI|nr:hypothetical protein LTR36_000275 [Oleoguttula mirabilis]